MKIALISTPWIKVPPVGYGGTEAVVTNLTEGLVKKGHNVTLFATGDSITKAGLEFLYPRALGNDLNLKVNAYYQLDHIYHFFKNVAPAGFDIIHNHNGRIPCFFLDLQETPFIHTLHGSYNTNLDDKSHINREARNTLLKFRHHPYISISNKQREDIPELNFIATVYNSIQLEKFPFNPEGGDRIVWLGRVSPTKGVDTLINTAVSANKPLALSLFVDRGEQEYFKNTIQPLLKHPLITVVDEIKDEKRKNGFLAGGRLFLFPINWDEPFGLVMIEAMATGTPVVAYNRGSVAEIIKDGETGFIVDPARGVDGLQEAIEKIYALPEAQYQQMRKNCRRHVENNFTVEKMVERYEDAYEKILSLKVRR